MDYAVLYNPIAGRGEAARVAGSVAAMLAERGHAVVEGRSEGPGDLRRLSRELGADVERVVVLGGDGSLREVAAGQLERPAEQRTELGVVPFGSGNVVARELGLPLDPLEAARVIAESTARPWDVGWARADAAAPEPFLAMAGVGYDAAVAERVAAARAARIGRHWYRWAADSLYVWVGISQMFIPFQPRFSLELDDEPLAQRVAAAVVSNAATYAKRMRLNPSARPDDGRLDLHVRRNGSFVHAAAALIAARVDPPGPSWVASTHSGRGVVAAACARGAGVPWQADGDPMGRVRRLSIQVERHALAFAGSV